MKALEWRMKVPKDKQHEFIEWFNAVAAPTFHKFGALKHELFKVDNHEFVPKQIQEVDTFIERVYFNDDFDIASYFANVRNDPKAWKLSRSYEEEFGASEIELRILNEV